MAKSRTNVDAQFRTEAGYGVYYRDENLASLLMDYRLPGTIYVRDPHTERRALEDILKLERETHSRIIAAILKGLQLEHDGESGVLERDAIRFSKSEPVRLLRDAAFIHLQDQRYETSAETPTAAEWSNAWVAEQLADALSKRRLAATKILLSSPAEESQAPARKPRGTVA